MDADTVAKVLRSYDREIHPMVAAVVDELTTLREQLAQCQAAIAEADKTLAKIEDNACLRSDYAYVVRDVTALRGTLRPHLKQVDPHELVAKEIGVHPSTLAAATVKHGLELTRRGLVITKE